MSTLDIKAQLLKELEQTNDLTLIKKVAAYFKKEKTYDFADDMPAWQIEAVKKGLKDLEEGRMVSWEEGMERIAKG